MQNWLKNWQKEEDNSLVSTSQVEIPFKYYAYCGEK